MRVYHMTSHEVATKYILPERRMKLSLFDGLNDPFELQPYSLSDKELRKIGRALTSHLASKSGLMCFSDNWRSPVMWAHYADKHRGMCLGFDVPHEEENRLISPVQYNIERLQFALDRTKDMYGIDGDFIRALMFTKSKEWAYEQEWRTLANLEIQDPVTGHHYVDFGPNLQLREVIIGSRNETPVGQIAKLIRGSNQPVKVLKARAAFQEFAMVQNINITPIRVSPKLNG